MTLTSVTSLAVSPADLKIGAEIGVLQTGDRIADPLALEVGERLHRPVLEHDQAVERRFDQRAEAQQRQPFLDLQHQVRLVSDGDIGLAGGHQPRRRAGIGRGDEIDIEAVAGEVAALLGDDQRRVIRVDEPVKQHRQLVGGLHLKWIQKGNKRSQAQQPIHHFHGSRFPYWLSAAHGVRLAVMRSTIPRRITDIAMSRISAANITSVCARALANSMA